MADPSLDVGPEGGRAEIKGLGMETVVADDKHQQAAQLSDTDTEDLNAPTEEELATLRRVPGRIPWICFTVAFVELCERFAYYGTTAVRMFNSSIWNLEFGHF
jgi:POT family proton-dependent oligopeptide transporter